MVWKLIRKIARLYAFIAICVLGLMLASDQFSSHSLSSNEALLKLFFPYGALAGLVISWINMRLGGWITLLSIGGFYLTSYWQSNAWPQSDLPLLSMGAAPIFLLAASIKSAGKKSRR